MYSKLIALLGGANRIMIFTGAGISTASGIPDFRGPDGVWARRKPVSYQDFMTMESARIEYWDYKYEGWDVMSKARPNTVHQAIVKLEKAEKVINILTQNIDGLHLLAGTDPERLIELHGTNLLVKCQSCGQINDAKPFIDDFRIHRNCPCCPCGGFLKIATISFGQNLEARSLERARDATYKADLVVALGTTLSVTPAASFPLMAAQRGIPYIIVNRGPTEHDNKPCVSLRIEGEVTEIFPPAVDAVLS
jgi:NAD-dependent deacetylase